MSDVLRWMVRTAYAPGKSLPDPWPDVTASVFWFLVFLLGVSILYPPLVRLVGAVVTRLIRAAAWLMLLPDLLFTTIRRHASRPVPAWVFPYGDAVVKGEQALIKSLTQARQWRFKRVKLVVACAVLLAATPGLAWAALRIHGEHPLKAAAASVLSRYGTIHRWAVRSQR